MNNKGLIYLSGGGNWDKTQEIDKHFLDNVKDGKILFFPVAKETDEAGYSACFDWLKTKLEKIAGRNVDIIMELDFNKYQDLNQFNAIYIGGGNTYKLLKLMNEANFLPKLNQYIIDGGIVYGASAGAVIMGKDISTYIEENTGYDYELSSSMSLVNNYSVICHYEESNSEKIEDFIARNHSPVIGIPVGAALAVQSKHLYVLGKEPISLFGTDGTSRELKPDSTQQI